MCFDLINRIIFIYNFLKKKKREKVRKKEREREREKSEEAIILKLSDFRYV